MLKIKGCGPNIFVLAGGVVQSFDGSKAKKSILPLQGSMHLQKGFCGDVIGVPLGFFIGFIRVLSWI